MRPVLRRGLAEKGDPIYQPMFKSGLVEEARETYDTEYVRNHSLNFSEGVGNLFVDARAGVHELFQDDVISLEPTETQAVRRLNILSGINVLEWQLWLHEQLPSMELLSHEQRRYIKARFGGAGRLNKMLIAHYRGML